MYNNSDVNDDLMCKWSTNYNLSTIFLKIMKFVASNIVDGWFCICNSILSIYPCSLSLVYYTSLGFCVAENISETKSLRLHTLTQLRHVTSDNWIAFH